MQGKKFCSGRYRRAFQLSSCGGFGSSLAEQAEDTSAFISKIWLSGFCLDITDSSRLRTRVSIPTSYEWIGSLDLWCTPGTLRVAATMKISVLLTSCVAFVAYVSVVETDIITLSVTSIASVTTLCSFGLRLLIQHFITLELAILLDWCNGGLLSICL